MVSLACSGQRYTGDLQRFGSLTMMCAGFCLINPGSVLSTINKCAWFNISSNTSIFCCSLKWVQSCFSSSWYSFCLRPSLPLTLSLSGPSASLILFTRPSGHYLRILLYSLIARQECSGTQFPPLFGVINYREVYFSSYHS